MQARWTHGLHYRYIEGRRKNINMKVCHTRGKSRDVVTIKSPRSPVGDALGNSLPRMGT